MALEDDRSTPSGTDLSLDEAADLVGVHYMTVYRWVRTSRLPAEKSGGRWVVTSEDVLRVAAGGSAAPVPVPVESADGRVVSTDAARDRLFGRLVEGDGAGAIVVVEEALVGGLTPEDVHFDLIGAAMHRVGNEWADGTISVADEHRATAGALRLMGALAHHFHRRGRRRGTILLGAPAGDRHALPLALLVDPVRGRGFDVVDLGADVPSRAFGVTAGALDRVTAVGIHVSVTADGAVSEAIEGLRAAIPGVPVVLGGSAIRDRSHADGLGADRHARSPREALEQLTTPS